MYCSLWYKAPTSCNTQSSAPEDGQNNCPTHVELTGIINRPLLLHPFGFSIIYVSLYFLKFAKQSQFNPYPENA